MGYDSKKIIESRGGTCQMFDCDRDATEVHHMDHDRDNNEPDNLVILCKGCHEFVHNYMGFDRYHELYKPASRKKNILDNLLNSPKYEWLSFVLTENNIQYDLIYQLFNDMDVELE